MTLRIEDYALIGDTETAALVGNDGSIDWLCLPRFDSAACFCALLGDARHGRWKIAPACNVKRVERRYRGDTLVLETLFETDAGDVRVVDCMPPRDDLPDVVRIVEGVRGRVPMRLQLRARFDYGRIVPWVRVGERAVELVAGPDALFFEAQIELTCSEEISSDFVVLPGDRVAFRLGWYPSHHPIPRGVNPLRAVEHTERWWKNWAGRAVEEGPYGDAIRRSLITLKALTYAPTGGIVAAATTSLPEQLGGVRNWDYRFCWLRDAAFTLYALLSAGYRSEAEDWRKWLLRAAAGDPAQLQIMYGLAGEHRLPEYELPWLPGYEASRPVRVGNAAVEQFQLDVTGELLDTLHLGHELGMAPDRDAWNLSLAVLEYLENHWQDPDDGIWEVRGPRRHFTHSKVMAWVAMDRAVRMVKSFGFDGPVKTWERLRDRIHAQVCAEAYDTKLEAFVQSYGSKQLDASVLQMALSGFLPATDRRIVNTVKAIEHRLVRGGFVYRYSPDDTQHVDGLPPGEGAFLACTLWLADVLSLMERHDEARQYLERVLDVRNDVGLLAEEYDPDAGRLVGNFPQAFSHVYLIHTARNVSIPYSAPPESAHPSFRAGAL